MIGIDAEYIAFTGLAEVPLDIADPIDAIARNPTERHASRKGALDHLDRKLRLGQKADVVRHICGRQASRIVGPALRQIERPIDESMAVTRHVGSKNTDLTVRNFAAYVSRHGHAFIDRALYLPKGWTDDPARLKATYVPDNVSFLTKPQLAVEMIERALAAGVPFRWVAADSVYGVGDIERDLRQAGKGYVLGVNSNHWFASWGKPQRVAGTAEEIAKTQRRSDWRRLSAGAGTKGPRLHDWCYLELAD